MAKDWFRKKRWTDEDQADFFAHLKTARGQSAKAQYLRVQAAEFLQAGTEDTTRAAMALLQRLLTDYPERLELAPAFDLLGECCDRLGLYNDAISFYRKAVDHQRAFPNVQTTAYLSFALLIAKQRRRNDYSEALSILDEWGCLNDFPVMIFEIWAARALIYKDKGMPQEAVKCARHALDAAAATHSGFRNHPRLGLVGEKDRWLVEQMETISIGR